MPRAEIPYEDLRAKLETMFPWPTCRVRLRTPNRSNDVKAPVTIYDRSQGNFQRIGYKCEIIISKFTGLDEDLERTYWEQRRMTVMVEV